MDQGELNREMQTDFRNLADLRKTIRGLDQLLTTAPRAAQLAIQRAREAVRGETIQIARKYLGFPVKEIKP